MDPLDDIVEHSRDQHFGSLHLLWHDSGPVNLPYHSLEDGAEMLFMRCLALALVIVAHERVRLTPLGRADKCHLASALATEQRLRLDVGGSLLT